MGDAKLIASVLSHLLLLCSLDSTAGTPQHKRLLKFYAAGNFPMCDTITAADSCKCGTP
jgi:hypothetical protein